MNNNYVKAAVDIVLFMAVFVLLHAILLNGSLAIGNHFGVAKDVLVAVGTALGGLLTILLFAKLGWSPYSREYIASRPWGAMVWVVLLTLGTVVPSQWIIETMDFEMPKETADLMTHMMQTPWGYLAIGVLAPVAEEMLFRGAVLRRLLGVMPANLKWVAIAISAILFGAMHLNVPQFLHATLMGLLIGWMYSRTNSIVPGIVFHWVNNTIAFIAFHLMPQAVEGKLVDLFQGNERSVYMALAFSLCIFLPSLFQLTLRLKK